MTTYIIYTDASHDTHTDLAVCGYYLKVNGRDVRHINYTLTGIPSSGMAEAMAILLSLQDCLKDGVHNTHFVIYSDNLMAMDFMRGKDFSCLMGLRTLRSVVCRKMLDSVNSLQLEFIKGHSPFLGADNRYNDRVDRSVRTTLRQQRQYFKNKRA